MKALRVLWRRRWREVVGATLICSAGLISLDPLRGKSLDYLFALRGPISTSSTDFPRDIAIVFLEGAEPGNWKPYADLLIKLTERDSQMVPNVVVFDFVFENKAWETDANLVGPTNYVNLIQFSNIVRQAATRTRVVFATSAKREQTGILIGTKRPRKEGTAIRTTPEPLLPLLSNLQSSVSNTDVGLANLPGASTTVKRRYYGADTHKRPLAFTAAAAVMDSFGKRDYSGFFLNYYGPAGTFVHYNWSDIANVPEPFGTFSPRIVFVGDNETDVHRTPFTFRACRKSSGAEIHATACANLLRSAWLGGLCATGASAEELFLVLALGLICGWHFPKWTPRRAFVGGLGSAPVVGVLSFLLFVYAHYYVPWLSIVVVMTPIAVGVSFLPVQSAFISYRSAVKADADNIANHLVAFGVEIYLDRMQNSQVGWLTDGLLPEVQKRQSFILLVSSNLFPLRVPSAENQEPDWVGEEIGRALSCEKDIVPVYLDMDEDRIKAVTSEVRTFSDYTCIYTHDCKVSPVDVLTRRFFASYTSIHSDSSILDVLHKLRWAMRRH